MSRFDVDGSMDSGSFDHFLRFLLILGVTLAGSFFLVYLYQFESQELVENIDGKESVIVFNKIMISYIFGASGFVLTLLSAVIVGLFREILRRPMPKMFERINEWCTYGVVLSLILLLSGGMLFNPYWYHRLEQAGYVHCTNNVLHLKTQIFQSVWVRDRSWCQDPKVSEILRDEGFRGAGTEKVNQYIDRTYKESGNAL